MTVLPGSLDNLYYNGILDHIPYEAYEYEVANPYGGMINPYSGLKQAVAGANYRNIANGGLIYDTYNSKDTFVRNGNSGFSRSTGRDYSINGNSRYDETGTGFIDSIRNAGVKTKEAVLKAPASSIWKGLAVAALIIATPILIIKGRKKPPKEVTEVVEKVDKPNFWSKLNPKNWFKK